MSKQFGAAGIKVHMPAAWEPGTFLQETETLREVKRTGNRVLFLLAYDDDIKTVASHAAREGMLRAGFAWLRNEAAAQATGLEQGFMFMRSLLPSKGMQAFAEHVSDYSKSSFNISLSTDAVDLTYSVALHDAVMLYAHAATSVLAEGGNLNDGQVVTAAVRSTKFVGIGSIVALNQDGDRIETYEVMSYVAEADSTMATVPIGLYNSTEQQYVAYERSVIWPGNTSCVPIDSGVHEQCNSDGCWDMSYMIAHMDVHRAVYTNTARLP